ncbi:MucBP domain-containing protein, partial [Vagococcus hydrophili]
MKRNKLMRQISTTIMAGILLMQPLAVSSSEINHFVKKDAESVVEKETTSSETQEATKESTEDSTESSSSKKLEESSTSERIESTQDTVSEESSSEEEVKEETKDIKEKLFVNFMVGEEVYKEVSVEKGEKIEKPKDPIGKGTFLGWFDKNDKKVTFEEVIDEETVYHAKFSEKFLIQFKDSTGTIIDSYERNKNENIEETKKDPKAPADKFFMYWYDESDPKEQPFSFELNKVSKDLVLVPKFSDTHTVLFISEGTQVEPVQATNGKGIEEPTTPTRSGYTFKHWSLKPKGEKYDFATPITGNVTLYAVWEAAEAEYTVVFWREKLGVIGDPGSNPDNYEYAGTSTKQKGLSGTEIDIKSEQEVQQILEGNANYYTRKGIEYYTFDHSKKDKLSGNGETTINVYSRLRIYNYQFYILDPLNGFNKNGIDYFGKRNQNGNILPSYEVKAKFGENVERKFPQPEEMIIRSNNFFYALSPWRQESLYPVNWLGKTTYISTTFLPKDPSKENLGVWIEFEKELKEITFNEYLENVEGTDFKGPRIFKNNMTKNKITYHPRDIRGFFTPMKQEFDPAPDSIDLKYKRKSFNLSYDLKGGTFISDVPISKNLKFEGEIASPGMPIKNDYDFKGWYYDDEYRNRVDFENLTMPANDLKFFAKWESQEIKVKYLDGVNGKELLEQGYGKNETVKFPREYVKNETFVEDKGVFMGWYWLIGGTTYSEFTNTIPLTKDITLYAKWKTNPYYVTYDKGRGTGEVPEDKNIYSLGSVGRVLTSDSITPPKNHVFIGWRSNKDFNLYQVNALIPVKGDTLLTAEFAPENETIHINYHNGDEVKQSSAYKNTNIQLAGEIFNKEGAKLIGWSKSANGEKDYDLSADFKTADKDIDLYAVWEKQEISITFKADEGGKLEGNPIRTIKIPYGVTWDKVIKNIPKTIPNEFYEFAEWDPNLPGKDEILTKNLTFTAKFKKQKAQPVIIKYVDEIGNELADEERLEGALGVDYQAEPKKIEGWTLKETPENAKGVFKTVGQTVTFVYVKEANSQPVIVRYQDGLGNTLAPEVVLTGKLGLPYKSEEKKIPNWELEGFPYNISGTFKESIQYVTYRYKKAKGAPVTVRFVDRNGKQLANPVVMNGFSGEAYTAKARNVTGWQLVGIPDNMNGFFSENPLTVVFVYDKAQGVNVTVRYVDESYTDIVEPDILSGKLDETYQTTAKEIEGWTLKETATNAEGVFTSEEQEVFYVYEKEEGAKVTAKYVDESGKELAEKEVLSGKLDESYETTAKEIEGWKLKETPKNAKGTFTKETQEVVYVYEKEEGAKVTAKYVDKLGKELAEKEELSGKLGESYETKAKVIEGWKLKENPKNAKGTFTKETQEVVYVYEKVKEEVAKVTAKYVDKLGKELAEKEELSGKLGESYETKAKAIDGWILKETPKNAKGTFTKKMQEVVYVYEKVKEEISKVNVKYVDESGKELSKKEVLSGKLGETYETKAKEIEGWKLKETPKNAKGTFTKEMQEVIYIYEKVKEEVSKVNVKYVDESGKELSTKEELSGKLGESYETKAKEIEGWKLKETPKNAKGTFTKETQEVVYVYEKVKEEVSKVNVKYVDESGKELSTKEELSGKLGESYETKAKVIEGWTLKETPKNAKGTFTKETQEVVYVYEKVKEEVAKVNVKYVDEEGKELAEKEV